MERKYFVLIGFFLISSLISLVGFYKTYFQYFPEFENIAWKTHLHFSIFLTWFGLLIVQPYLIKKKKLDIHRTLGKLSFFLAPLMVLSILMVVRLKVAGTSDLDTSSLVGITGAVLDCISFSVFYIYSVINKNNVRKHVMGMIGASLIVINPGLGRLITQLASQEVAILVMILTPILSALAIMLYEKHQFHRPVLKSIFWMIVLIWLLEVALFAVLPQTGFWAEWMRLVFTI